MSEALPPHHENPHTFGTYPIQFLEGVGETPPPGTKAQPRPADRPRPKGGEPGWGTVEFQFLDGVAEPVPPGTKAKPRPPGRERWRTVRPGTAPAAQHTEQRVRKFVALLKDRRTVTVLGTGIRFLAECATAGNGGAFAVVVRDNGQEQFVAVFQASELSCIFEGELSSVSQLPS